MTATRADATHPAGFLHKPVNDQDLQQTLERALREAPARPDTPGPLTPPGQAGFPAPAR
jgi:hypothetical protein